MLSSINYTEYSLPDTAITGFAFTGEWRSTNETQYHRARHYNPTLGVFPSLDPFEGTVQRPMSLNGYSWVEGNTPNWTDASGFSRSFAATINSGICSSNIESHSNCRCCETPLETMTCEQFKSIGVESLLCSCGDTEDAIQMGSPSLPSWFINDKDRICGQGKLCDLLGSDNDYGLDTSCKSYVEQMCHLFCNNEVPYETGSYAHKGLIIRWEEYFRNPLNLGRTGRQGHQTAYERVQREFADVYFEWNIDGCGRNSQVAEVVEFDELARRWRGQSLQIVSVPDLPSVGSESPFPQLSPDSNGIQYGCLMGRIAVCGFFLCFNGDCSPLLLPPIG